MGGIASGLGDIGSGAASLFSGGDQAPAAGQPGGPELVGPPSPYQAPSNFMQGFVQGFMGAAPGAGADVPTAPGGKVGGGIGELVRAIQAFKDPMSTANPLTGPIVNLVGQQLRGPEEAQLPFGYKPAGTPSNIIQGLLSSYTGGLLGSNKMGV
jgi:hypothetical protein